MIEVFLKHRSLKLSSICSAIFSNMAGEKLTVKFKTYTKVQKLSKAYFVLQIFEFLHCYIKNLMAPQI